MVFMQNKQEVLPFNSSEVKKVLVLGELAIRTPSGGLANWPAGVHFVKDHILLPPCDPKHVPAGAVPKDAP